jgi:hypothetical protein
MTAIMVVQRSGLPGIEMGLPSAKLPLPSTQEYEWIRRCDISKPSLAEGIPESSRRYGARESRKRSASQNASRDGFKD